MQYRYKLILSNKNGTKLLIREIVFDEPLIDETIKLKKEKLKKRLLEESGYEWEVQLQPLKDNLS